MSLSHQSLRKFDTFINFVQLYLLTIKTKNYTSSEGFAFYMKMYLLKRSAEMRLFFHTGILKVITPSKVKEELEYIFFHKSCIHWAPAMWKALLRVKQETLKQMCVLAWRSIYLGGEISINNYNTGAMWSVSWDTEVSTDYFCPSRTYFPFLWITAPKLYLAELPIIYHNFMCHGRDWPHSPAARRSPSWGWPHSSVHTDRNEHVIQIGPMGFNPWIFLKK